MWVDLDNFKVEIYTNNLDCKEKVIIPKLSHGSNIVEIITGDENVNDCDAVFTKSKNFKLGIKTADCASVCYGDGKIIGVAHIGWSGLCTDLNSKMLEKFDKSKLKVFIGPFIYKFEIKKDYCYDKLQDKFTEFIEFEGEKMYFNFKKALLSIIPENVVILDGRDTFSDLSLPSHRRNGTRNRLLTVISF